MKLIRYNDPLSTQLRAFDNWLGQPLGGGAGPLNRLFDLAQGLSGSGNTASDGRISADLYEDDDHYFVRVEMPGVKKNEVKVSLDERLLSLAVERETEAEGAEGEERLVSKRALTVPEGIDAEKVAAKLEDGILTVTLPKAELRKPQKIKVS